jgi:RNA methyltransferase, TrmH family
MSLTSSKRPLSISLFKKYMKLLTRTGRLKTGAFLMEGEKAIKQIQYHSPDKIIDILTSKDASPAFKHCSTRFLSEKQLRSLCLTTTPQGIIAVVCLPTEIYTDRLPDNTGSKILVLEDIQDPGNVGTLIRTASAFGFSGVILSDKCADPLSPKCVQSTAGSVLSVWIRRTARYLKLVNSLKTNKYSLIAADLKGTEQPSLLHSKEMFLLALGNEASGLSKELTDASDLRIRIPLNQSKAESLNVGVCGAILMYLSSTNA